MIPRPPRSTRTATLFPYTTLVRSALVYCLDNRPSEACVSVLWGDPTPSNTMFRPDGTVAALIDWELAALGPPEIDLAWWLYFDELFSITFGVKRLEGLPDRKSTRLTSST